MRTYQLLIGGRWVDAVSGKTFDDLNPATAEVLPQAAEAHAEDVGRAIAAARVAFDEGPWGRMPAAERGRILLRIADLLERDAEQIARLESADNGRPIRETSAQRIIPRWFRYFAGWADKIEGETIPVEGPYLNYTVRVPLGVIGQITPALDEFEGPPGEYGPRKDKLMRLDTDQSMYRNANRLPLMRRDSRLSQVSEMRRTASKWFAQRGTVLLFSLLLCAVSRAQVDRFYGEPIELSSRCIYFTSWKYVRQGNFAWQIEHAPNATEEEKNIGVALIDIGGGTTDIAVFHQGSIWHTAVIALGGNHISNDISVGLRTAPARIPIAVNCLVMEPR